MVAHKDIVLAIIGAAAGLAGLTLVFLGVVVGDYEQRSGALEEPTRHRYERIASLVLLAFVTSITCVALATIWLLTPDEGLFVVLVTAFFASLLILLVVTLIVVRRLLARREAGPTPRPTP